MRLFRDFRACRLAARLFLLALMAGLAACQGDNKDANAEEAPVARRSISASYEGTATLEPESEAQVAAKVNGVLLKLMVEEGDRVTQGQVLAKLDDEIPRLNLAKAEAVLRKLENDFRRSQEMFERKLLNVEQNDKIR